MTSVALQGALFGTGDWDVAVLGIGVSTPAQLRPFFSGPLRPCSNFSAIDNSTYRTAAARAVRRVGRAGCRFWLDGERALFRAANLAPDERAQRRHLREQGHVHHERGRHRADQPEADRVT